jgi:hypothetical protein
MRPTSKLHKSVMRRCYPIPIEVEGIEEGMTALPARHQKLQAVMKHGFMTFIEAAKPRRRRAHLRLVAPPSQPLPQVLEEMPLDPVELTVLAVNRLGLATFRTATSGKVSTVAVPDARTAEIFRAALLEMQKARRTDRLVDIVVAGDGGSGLRGRDVRDA